MDAHQELLLHVLSGDAQHIVHIFLLNIFEFLAIEFLKPCDFNVGLKSDIFEPLHNSLGIPLF